MFSFFLEESPKLSKIQWIEVLCFSPSLKHTENQNLKPINSVNFRRYFRGRLNPHRLPWCGKPRTFGDHACHMILRYSCQHFRFWYLQLLLQLTFRKLQNVLLPFYQMILFTFLSFCLFCLVEHAAPFSSTRTISFYPAGALFTRVA